MAPYDDNRLKDVLRQGYFDFYLDLDAELEPQDKALLTVMGGLDYSAFNKGMSRDPKVGAMEMCTMIVYCAMNGRHSSRAIERLSRRDSFLLSLLGPGVHVDHTTVSRFMKCNGEAISGLLPQVAGKLHEMGEVKGETVFQDGTKVESRAGRYTFVWKGAVEKNIEKAARHVEEDIRELEGLGVAADGDGPMEKAASILSGRRIDERLARPGKGKKADREMRALCDLRESFAKIRGYEEAAAMIGDKRKSMSKTDPDATFMRMKEDHMGNGQLKPAYNYQVATDSGYIVGATVSSDRADYRTCIPMMERLKATLGWKYENYAADSGYDLTENFRYLEREGINAYIKPQDWEQARKRSYRKDIGRYENMAYDGEADTFTCANGKRLAVTRTGVSGKKTYECVESCHGCPLREACMKRSKKDRKTLECSHEHWRYREEARARLNTPEGIQMRLNRSIQAEGAFAQVKANRGFRRFLCFGMERGMTEWIIQCLAVNVIHLANRVFGDEPEEEPFWYVPPGGTGEAC